MITTDSMAADRFRENYDVDAGVQIFTTGDTLPEEGGILELFKPGQPYEEYDGDTKVPKILIEEVGYSTIPPWPGVDAGSGLSLQRKSPDAFGDDPASWEAAAPTPGKF